MSATGSQLSDIAGRATITVPEAARVLGISTNAAYRAVDAREIPSLRLGRRILVPVPKLLALLGDKSEQHGGDTA